MCVFRREKERGGRGERERERDEDRFNILRLLGKYGWVERFHYCTNEIITPDIWHSKHSTRYSILHFSEKNMCAMLVGWERHLNKKKSGKNKRISFFSNGVPQLSIGIPIITFHLLPQTISWRTSKYPGWKSSKDKYVVLKDFPDI